MRIGLGKQSSKKTPRTRLALDVGTEYAKALVVSTEEVPTLLGYGRARQFMGDMEDGAVARISGVVECCRKAIEQAHDVAGHYPVEAVIGVAGEHIHGLVTRQQVRRRRPTRPISPIEFRKLLEQVRTTAQKTSVATMERQTGLHAVDVQLLNSTLLEVKIDGYRVRDPEQFRGTYVELTVFHTFSPLVHIGALHTIADRLGLVVLRTVAEPFAVASSLSISGSCPNEAIVVDVGGGSTDLALIRDGVVIETKSLPVGGRSFTRSLARHFSVDVEEAESIKLDYSARLLDEPLTTTIAGLFQQDIRVWRDALRIGFADMSREAKLPKNLLLCGGGAALPGIQSILTATEWERELFERPPQVRLLGPDDIAHLADPDVYLAGLGDVTPKSLGMQAATYRPESSPWATFAKQPGAN